MPISFTCPHCGERTEVAEQFAGRSGPCVKCGQPVTIPGPADAALASSNKAAGKPATLATLLIVAVVAVLVCVVVIWLVALPQIERNREKGRVDACSANLRQIGKALRTYQDRYGSLPPAYVADEKGRPMHSWRVLILPYMESEELQAIYFKQYRFDEPWNGPHNRTLAKKMPPVFRCPSDISESESSGGETSYLAVTGPGTVFDGVKPQNFERAVGGPENVIMVVEAAQSGVNWLEPRDMPLKDMPLRINQSPEKGIRSRHPGGANVLCGDGQPKFLPDSSSADTLEPMITILPGGDSWLGGEGFLR